MANFTPSNLVKAQAILKQQFNEAEMRKKQSAVLGLAMKNNDVLIPSYKELRTREDRAVSAYIHKRSSRVPAAARAALHTGARGDSFAQDLTWETFADTFSMSIKQLDNNVFTFDQAFASELRNSAINLHAAVETAGIDHLIANKTQINAATVGGTFNAANDAFEIAANGAPRFYQTVKSMMRQNKYNGMLDVVASPQTYVDAEFYLNQGNANAVNTGFQFAGLNIIESIELADVNYAGGVSLVMPENNFGALPWIPKQNRQGWGDGELNGVGRFMSILDPLGSGMEFALSVYALRADNSGSNGDAQDVTLQFEMSIDMAWVLAPLSTATESVVYEVAQML
jgi:hypothetical protein